jgi:hypothetical protein
LFSITSKNNLDRSAFGAARRAATVDYRVGSAGPRPRLKGRTHCRATPPSNSVVSHLLSLRYNCEMIGSFEPALAAKCARRELDPRRTKRGTCDANYPRHAYMVSLRYQFQTNSIVCNKLMIIPDSPARIQRELSGIARECRAPAGPWPSWRGGRHPGRVGRPRPPAQIGPTSGVF